MPVAKNGGDPRVSCRAWLGRFLGGIHHCMASSTSGGHNLSQYGWASFHKPVQDYHFLFPFYFSMACISHDSLLWVSPVLTGGSLADGWCQMDEGGLLLTAPPEAFLADSNPQPP